MSWDSIGDTRVACYVSYGLNGVSSDSIGNIRVECYVSEGFSADFMGFEYL